MNKFILTVSMTTTVLTLLLNSGFAMATTLNDFVGDFDLISKSSSKSNCPLELTITKPSHLQNGVQMFEAGNDDSASSINSLHRRFFDLDREATLRGNTLKTSYISGGTWITIMGIPMYIEKTETIYSAKLKGEKLLVEVDTEEEALESYRCLYQRLL